jgi:hypothetical protein
MLIATRRGNVFVMVRVEKLDRFIILNSYKKEVENLSINSPVMLF